MPCGMWPVTLTLAGRSDCPCFPSCHIDFQIFAIPRIGPRVQSVIWRVCRNSCLRNCRPLLLFATFLVCLLFLLFTFYSLVFFFVLWWFPWRLKGVNFITRLYLLVRQSFCILFFTLCYCVLCKHLFLLFFNFTRIKSNLIWQKKNETNIIWI